MTKIEHQQQILEALGINLSASKNILEHIVAGAPKRTIGIMLGHEIPLLSPLYAEVLPHLDVTATRNAVTYAKKNNIPLKWIFHEAWHQHYGVKMVYEFPGLIKD